MIKLFLITIVSFRILYILYFKFKYKFWSRQPVFHTYNLLYWINPPGIIDQIIPKIDKFYDHTIITQKEDNLTLNQKSDIHKLIFFNYLQENDIQYKPTKKSIFNYLQNHDSPSYISMYYKDFPIFDITNQINIVSKKLIAAITSRPLYCFLNSKQLPLNYVDFLCVNKEKRKKGVAPKIIYTHTTQLRKNSKSVVFLFKRENDISLPIVPLSTYYTYGFDTKYWKYSSKPISEFNHFKLNSQNIDNFYHIIEKIKKQFKCTVYPALSNLNTLIKNDLITIYMLLKKNDPIACYVFRKPFTTYKRDGKIGNSMDLICSFFDRSINPEIFVYYFYFSTFIIQKNKQFKYFIIENISDNNIIIQNIFKKFFPIIKSPTAYFFYNFAYRPILPHNLFVLN